MKFGGTSMAGTERIRRVAQIVKRQAERGDEVAVVVSAMSGETDRLVGFCREANPLYDPAEYDVVVASGEQVTSGLLALTLQAMGCKARSWLDLLNAVYAAMGRTPVVSFVDMPVHLRDKYQYFTEADPRKLRAAGCQHVFAPLEEAVRDYVQGYLENA